MVCAAERDDPRRVGGNGADQREQLLDDGTLIELRHRHRRELDRLDVAIRMLDALHRDSGNDLRERPARCRQRVGIAALTTPAAVGGAGRWHEALHHLVALMGLDGGPAFDVEDKMNVDHGAYSCGRRLDRAGGDFSVGGVVPRLVQISGGG